MKESLVFFADLHLERMEYPERRNFLRGIALRKEQIVVLGGDIALALSTPLFLSEIAIACSEKRVCFVLGNHDFFGDSVSRMKRIISYQCSHYTNLHFLDRGDVIQIGGTKSCLIGDSGWADARCGLKHRTYAPCREFELVEELRRGNRSESFQAMRFLADASAKMIGKSLEKAAALRFNHIIVVTHVPPFHQAVKFHGKENSPIRLPFYVNVALGTKLLSFAKKHRNLKITVLCGHTHSAQICRIARNIEICVAEPRVALVMK